MGECAAIENMLETANLADNNITEVSLQFCAKSQCYLLISSTGVKHLKMHNGLEITNCSSSKENASSLSFTYSYQQKNTKSCISQCKHSQCYYLAVKVLQ